MNADERPERVVVFGSFQFRVTSKELRKGGVRIRLEDKPASLLAILLENPGKLLSREELHSRLWAEGIHVDFEHGLNKTVNKLRAALHDDAEQPRYIETLSRRGYRFIGPTEVLPSEPLPPHNGETGGFATPTIGSAPPLARPGATLLPRPFPKWFRAALLCVLTVLWLAAVYLGWKGFHTPAQAESHAKRIVVLPFGNLTGDPSEDYLCDGLTEEMIARLSVFNPSRLGVIARTSAMHYKGSTKTAKAIGEELGADYLLESSVRRSGNRLRITTQLIDTRSQAHLWVGNYDREFQDVLDVQREVALAIAKEIPMQPSTQKRPPSASPRAVNAQALELYLRGRYSWNKRTPAEFRKAIDYFEQALLVDPNYAEAYSGLADSYALLASSSAIPYRDGYPKAREMALKALELDEGLAEARTSLAFVKGFYDWQFAEAEKEFRRAIEQNFNYATAHHWYGLFLSLLGRHSEAITELEIASRLDPAFVATTSDLADAYRRAGQYQRAVELYGKARELDPNYFLIYQGMAEAYASQHKFQEAEAESAELNKLTGNHLGIAPDLVVEYLKAGQRDRAQALLNDMRREALKRGQSSSTCQLAIYVYAAFGDRDKAMACLEEAFERRPDWMIEIKSDPRLEGLHSDPRFQELLGRMGFPP